MKIDVLDSMVLDPILGWAAEQAAREGVAVERIVARALARERAIVEGRKVDTRIVAFGEGTGGHTKSIPAGAYDIERLARVTGRDPDLLLAWTRHGYLESIEPISRGRRTAWNPDEARIAILVAAADELGLDGERIGEAVAAARRAPRWKGIALVWAGLAVTPRLIGDGHVGAAVRESGAVRAISLEAVDHVARRGAQKADL